MAKKNQVILVGGEEISIKRIEDEDYISLTDMVGTKGRSGSVIQNWLRGRNTLEFLGVWERLFNVNFKVLEFEYLFSQSGLNRFTLSVKEWTETTNAIGIISKAGRNGGTYAHRDIAFEFGTFISPEFKLLLFRDYQRLKEEEYSRLKLEWNYQRFLTKVNYKLHTDTIKEVIIPRIQHQQSRTPDWIVYAEEADLLNMAVFGLTAKQWREENPELAKKGNIRDYAELVELNVLANIESTNAILIERGMNKEDRFQILSQASLSQYRRLSQHYGVKEIGD